MTVALLAVLTIAPAFQVPTMPVPPEFPKDFLGDWRGTMEWSKAGVEKPEKVAMRLRIAMTEVDDTYTYQLSYGEAGKDERPYVLKLAEAKTGHWIVDEQNGIVLDHYWVGDCLIGVFTVGGNTIVTKERLEAGRLVTEMVTYEASALKTTGGTGKEIPTVTTNRVKSIQRAELQRDEGRTVGLR